MRNAASWTPTKYDVVDDTLVASRNPRMLAAGSRLVTSLLAEHVGPAVATYARGRLVDLGCGRVPLYGLYAGHVTSVVGTDWPSSYHDHSHVDLFCDVGRPLPLRDGIADTIICSDVIEHLADATVVFAELGRVLAPGGVLVLNTPFMYRVHEAPHDYLRHTRYSLDRLARTSGMEVVELIAVGGVVDVIADNLAKALAEIPVVGRIVASSLQRIVLGFGRTRLGRRARNATSEMFPLCHVLVARRPSPGEGSVQPD